MEWIDEPPRVLGRVDMSVSALGSVPQTLGAITWMADEGDPSVKTYQAWLNRMLDRCGYNGILIDGRVGKYTCGAGAMLGDLKNNPCYVNALATDPVPDTGVMATVLSVCQTFTFPTKKGQTKPDKPTSTLTPEELALPWGVQDGRTTKVQQDLNNDLDGHDYFPIPVTGVLDAKTCGAMRLASDEWGMDYMNAFGLNCQAFETPRKRPAAPPSPPPTPTCADDEQLDPDTNECVKIQCPPGQFFNPLTTACEPVSSSKTTKSGFGAAGVFLLALVAAGALYARSYL